MSSDRKLAVQLGAHASADPSDFGTVPAALVDVRIEGRYVPNFQYNYEERDYQTPDGEHLEKVQTTKNTDIGDLPPMHLRGLSGAGAGDGVSASTLSHELDGVFPGLFGAAASNATGDTTDATDAGSGANLNVAAGGTNLQDGDGVLIVTDAGVNVARQVVDASADPTIALDRALTDRAGTATTPTESQAVMAARRFRVTQNQDSVPFGFDFESKLERYRVFAALGELKFMFPPAGRCRVQIAGMKCYDWDDDQALQTPGFSAPTQGSLIPCEGAFFYVGATLYQAKVDDISLGNVVGYRDGDGGPNLHWGPLVNDRHPIWNFTLRTGSATTPAEATAALKRNLNADNTYDVAMQRGASVGQCAYWRAPKMKITAVPTSENGQIVLKCTGECVADANGVSMDFFLF